jgi:hypothetical protein
LRNFLLSLPERALRSATALAGGLLREMGDVAIPRTIRRSQLYRNLAQAQSSVSQLPRRSGER